MSVSSQVPDVGTPVFDANGYMNPVWHQFFFMLLRRTGGTDGIDAIEQAKLIQANTIRIGAEEALLASMVAPQARPTTAAPESMVWPHGVHDEPELHATATAALDGFMSAADKAKLDGLAAPEFGTWTPSLTFTTPGDLFVSYGTRTGMYVKIGNLVMLQFHVDTTAFTYTTAVGALVVTGQPLANGVSQHYVGSMSFQGLNRVGYTQWNPVIAPGQADFNLSESGPGVVRVFTDTNSTASGSNISLVGNITYQLT